MTNKYDNLDESQVFALARVMYDSGKTDMMPTFDTCPYSYIQGYINHSADILELVYKHKQFFTKSVFKKELDAAYLAGIGLVNE